MSEGPAPRLLAEETLGAVSVAMAVGTDLQTLASSRFANTGLALVATLAGATVVEALVQRGNLATERLGFLLEELAISSRCLWCARCDALRRFIDPGKLT